MSDSQLEIGSKKSAGFIDDLSSFTSTHKTAIWKGTFAEYLKDILPANPYRLTRNSHQYIYDMMCWYRNMSCADDSPTGSPKELFTEDLFGIDDALGRVAEYFQAASAGSDVGRRLLLLLGPPSGGKSSIVILLKRAMEEYSYTDEGAIYALGGSPLHECH